VLCGGQDFVELSLLESIHGRAGEGDAAEFDDVTPKIASDKSAEPDGSVLHCPRDESGAERAAKAVPPRYDVNGLAQKKPSGRFYQKLLEFWYRWECFAEAARAGAAEGAVYSRGACIRKQGRARSCAWRGISGAGRTAALIVHSSLDADAAAGKQGLRTLTSLDDRGTNPIPSGRRFALARQGQMADARENFKNVEFAITPLPRIKRAVTNEAHARFRSRREGLLRGEEAAATDLVSSGSRRT